MILTNYNFRYKLAFWIIKRVKIYVASFDDRISTLNCHLDHDDYITTVNVDSHVLLHTCKHMVYTTQREKILLAPDLTAAHKYAVN